MSNRIIDGLPPLKAATDIPVYSLVYVTGGQYAIAGATDLAIGTALRAVKAGEVIQPRALHAGHMTVGIATAAIPAGTDVVQDANGQIKALPTSGGGTAILAGRTLEDSAAAAGDWVEYLPRRSGLTVTISA